jgi:hypothetical protein
MSKTNVGGGEVSYQSRQKKRRIKRTEAKARQLRNAATADRWFLIVAERPGRCDRCRDGFDSGAHVVYGHAGQLTRCERCASREPDSKGYKPGSKWESAKARQLSKELAA